MPITDYRISLSSIIEALRATGPRQRYDADQAEILLKIMGEEMPIDDQEIALTDAVNERLADTVDPIEINQIEGFQDHKFKRHVVQFLAKLALMSDKEFEIAVAID